MIKSSLLTLFFASIVIVVSSVRATSAQTTTCNDPDAKIISDIYARIKGDKALDPQRPHINVVSLYGAVKLQGWTDAQKDYDRLLGFVNNTSCVRLVNVSWFTATPPPPDSQTRSGNGCGAGMKACGDVCIPDTDTCSTMN